MSGVYARRARGQFVERRAIARAMRFASRLIGLAAARRHAAVAGDVDRAVEQLGDRGAIAGREDDRVEWALVAAASSQDVKDRLRAATGDAIDAGVFGVPSILADGELFWGLDSLPNLEAFLRGELAIDPAARAAFAALPVGAARRG